MSSTTSPPAKKSTPASPGVKPPSKGKDKLKATPPDNVEEDDDSDDEESGGEEEEEEEEEEDYEEIDPSVIVGRRTRGVRVDYTSKEALEKAGLKGDEDEDEDEDVVMKE